MIYVQKPLKLLCHENVPNYLIVFIGGFCDVVVGSLSRMAEEFPVFLDGATFVTAYYHWDGGGIMDVVPRIGGRWGVCNGADVNLAFSGYCHDSKGRFYTHKRPAPLLYECPSEDGQSLFRLATEWLKGYQSAMKPVK